MKMKREYTKPVVELVRFELNEAIATCDAKIFVSATKDAEGCELSTVFQDINFYDAKYGCDEKLWPVGYCYYSATDGVHTFNS